MSVAHLVAGWRVAYRWRRSRPALWGASWGAQRSYRRFVRRLGRRTVYLEAGSRLGGHVGRVAPQRAVGPPVGSPAVPAATGDLDPTSVEVARRNAADAGLNDRVGFVVADAASATLDCRYDLITMLESFHDMAHPVRFLGALRGLLATEGSLIVDMKAGERFVAPGDRIERYLYGWSVLSWLHDGLLNGGGGTGTVMRPATLRGYALEAGLPRSEVLPIEHDTWRSYRLRP